MQVAELIRRLSQFPPDAEVVVPSDDHSYLKVVALHRRQAEVLERRRLVEYHDDDSMTDETNPVVPVVVLV
jgi:hypothetical protein